MKHQNPIRTSAPAPFPASIPEFQKPPTRAHTSKHPIRRTVPALAALLLCACLALSACGSTSAPETYNTAAQEAPAADVARDIIPAVPGGEAGTEIAIDAAPAATLQDTGGATPLPSYTGSGGITQPQDDRKIVLYTTVHMETLAFDDTCAQIQQAVADTGGYIAGATINTDSYRSDLHTAAYTLKIPRDKFDSFSLDLPAYGTITSRSEAAEDITDQYIDVEAHLTALETQEARLLELMEQAGSLEELLQVQNQLTNVQYEIDLYRSTQRTYDGLIAYATMDIYVTEVQEYTPPAPTTFGSRVSAALKNTWHNTVSGLQNFSIFLIYALPTLVVLGVLLVITLFIIKLVRKHNAKKAAAFAASVTAWQQATNADNSKDTGKTKDTPASSTAGSTTDTTTYPAQPAKNNSTDKRK